MSRVDGATVLLPMAPRAGATFTSLTTTLMVSKSLSAGVPLSVTRMVTVFVNGPCVSPGVQEKTPPDVMLAPLGAPASSVKVNVCAGVFASVAVAAKVRSEPSLTDLLPMAARTGAMLGSVTMIWIVSESFSAGAPLSVTRIVTLFVPGPCAGVGVQVKTPAALTLAPLGAPASSEKVRAFVG